ncbi:MAG: DUF1028 domain-containing protein [Firmicutes bacterium]|nr:DUF1028 domain-containing protein [Bacillota bacterium]
MATFSIVGYDPKTEEFGIAVQSKFLASGAVVPFAKAGVGAIATQSWANTSYGPEGLALLEEGKTVEEVLEILTEKDQERHLRQVGIVDAKGNAATYTGDGCFDWAGGRTGPNYACQGNILVSEETVNAMALSFEQTEGELARRLAAALDAGQKAGGDRRGKQSAAILIVKDKGGYGGFNDKYMDLRVDDHKEPIKELMRLMDLFDLYFKKADPDRLLKIEGELALELQTLLQENGFYEGNLTGQFDENTKAALEAYHRVENFEERMQEGAVIDEDVFAYLQRHGSPR